MTTRRATCACGQLHVTCEGEPVRISMCHCVACQRRTGSVFGAQARFAREQVTAIDGTSTRYVRVADSGNEVTFHFCPTCGSTVYYELSAVPGHLAIAVGAFADPRFPAPKVSVYEARRHDWVQMPPGGDVEHWD
jgi:hypothetical protein